MIVLYICLTIIAIPFLFVLFILIKCQRDYLKLMKCVKLTESTSILVNKYLSWINLIQAQVGGGKTSFLAGISQFEAYNLKNKAESFVRWIQIIIPDVNYKELDSYIESAYASLRSVIQVYRALLTYEWIEEAFKGDYYDHVQRVSKYSLLKDYITAKCALMRNQYIGANFSVYNRITETFNFEYSYSMLDIKEEEVQKNYILPKYCVILFDEALLSLYKNTTSNSVAGDTGQDTSQRLIRHIGKETVRLYSTSQSISRQLKLIRELGTAFLLIREYEIVGQFKTIDSIYKFIEEHYRNKIDGNEDLMLKANKYKDKVSKFFDKRKKLFARTYLKYTVQIYYDEQDLGKEPEHCQSKTELKEFYFPLTWAWGTYNTTEFQFIDDFLNDLSNKTDIDLKVAKETLTDLEKKEKALEILKKNETAESKKEKEKKKGDQQKYVDLG